MAVFRVEKTKNYTVMSNYHLRDTNLSLKAKGLLSQILSLPDDWDYTLAGLSYINRESIDAIRTAVQELERAGYITRSRERKNNGQLGGVEYIILEQPQQSADKTTTPVSAPPIQEKPTSENPTQANSTLGKPMQLNKDKTNKEKELKTDLSNTDSIPFPALHVCVGEPEMKRRETASIQAYEIYRDIIQENLSYAIMLERHKHKKDLIDEIIDLILETVCTSRKTIRIAGDDYPAEIVKAKFLKLDGGHLEFILECLKKNTTEIRNIKKYMLAVLFNAPSTIDNYYTALVAHDMAEGGKLND